MQLKVNDLYQLQNDLDEEIYQKFSLTREGTSIRRRLALLVELGECVNETRCFKFWSVKGPSPAPVILEEYADGIHFLLSLGIDLKDPSDHIASIEASEDLTNAYLKMYELCLDFHQHFDLAHYHQCFGYYLGIAQRLGYTAEDIREHYLLKNQENHHRQDTNY
ncbi:dUTP diphosphatase [Dielma fastidiosa]|uniref:Dimeric dUTPase (All-alpha-NTP-PPase superfamily) n=1 Tax=Dielma fastidiosa TaxID=1034346 RepID=A0A318KIF3_9FIRM|nr:dUTP diphosphatase [Dielma fastidiosa]PXX77884.1 dimeric dUTPase (all-alpha-NTP-PPase superfamily) [Dielma fastidiosa]